ncbi:DNA repair protein RecN [bacterium]|nr:DNA repair protein RecN [bacterium]
MLRLLRIKNLAVIEDLEIEFNPGFTVLTGETGAGKSLIIGAIELLLGDRSDAALIRSGEEELIITGQFDLNPYCMKLVKKYGIEDNELVIQRIIRRNTKSQTRVNNEIASVSLIQKISEYLVDILGQHQHQRLLNKDYHLETLDAYAGIEERIEGFKEEYKKYREMKDKLRALNEKKQRKEELAELHRFQYDELAKAQLRGDEEEELKLKQRVIDNREQLSQISQFSYSTLFEEENSIINQLAEIRKQLTKFLDVDNKLKEPIDYLDTAAAAINECSSFISDYIDNIEYDEAEADNVRNRLTFITDLKLKYKKSIPELIDYLKELEHEEEDFGNLNKEIESINAGLKSLREKLQSEAEFLSQKRHEASGELKEQLRKELTELGMNQFQFETSFCAKPDDTSEFVLDGQGVSMSPNGFDEAEFFISLNVGEELRPLNKIVSGGELSRIMLAFKRILAQEDKIPVLIFDEIDSGVGGKTATLLGQKLKKLEKSHQVIVISHLHQIASQAGTHFYIEKIEKDGRTHVSVYRVDGEERIKELTRMMGVEKDKKYAKEFAEDLLAR